MAYGDVGGAITELVITCQTRHAGEVAIKKGDALCLTGEFVVSNDRTQPSLSGKLFGQALADATDNGVAIPVKVRGICIFGYSGQAPVVDGLQGVIIAQTEGEQGLVIGAYSPYSIGINLKVDTANRLVHVLL